MIQYTKINQILYIYIRYLFIIQREYCESVKRKQTAVTEVGRCYDQHCHCEWRLKTDRAWETLPHCDRKTRKVLNTLRDTLICRTDWPYPLSPKTIMFFVTNVLHKVCQTWRYFVKSFCAQMSRGPVNIHRCRHVAVAQNFAVPHFVTLH